MANKFSIENYSELLAALEQRDPELAMRVADNIDALSQSEDLLQDTKNDFEAMDAQVRDVEEVAGIVSGMDGNGAIGVASAVMGSTMAAQGAELSYEQVEEMAKAWNASYNAQHPVKYAFGQIGAAAGVLKNIPSQMRQNIQIAESAGLDCENALQKLARTSVETIGSAKTTVVNDAMAMFEKSAELYKSSVEKVHEGWLKAKEGLSKALHSTTKAIDTGLEFVTAGGWSRFCANMETRSYEHQIRKNDGAELFGLDDKFSTKVKENVGHIFTKLHNAKAGLDTSLSQDDYEKGLDSYVAYWSDVKSKCWGKTEEGAKHQGEFGSTSPMDKMYGFIDDVKEKVASGIDTAKTNISNGIESAKEGIVHAKDAAIEKAKSGAEFVKDKAVEGAKTVAGAAVAGATAAKNGFDKANQAVIDWSTEMESKVKEFVKEAPGKVAASAKKAGHSIEEAAKSAGAMVVQTWTNFRAGSLRMFAKVADKVALMESSAQRRELAAANEFAMEAKMQSSKARTYAESLNDIEQGKVKASYQLPAELENSRAAYLQAARTGSASPAITQALNSINDIEAKGIKQAQRQATLANIVHVLKNGGVIIEDKINMAECNRKLADAQNACIRSIDKAGRHELRADKVSEMAQSFRDKADAIQGKGGDESPTEAFDFEVDVDGDGIPGPAVETDEVELV